MVYTVEQYRVEAANLNRKISNSFQAISRAHKLLVTKLDEMKEKVRTSRKEHLASFYRLISWYPVIPLIQEGV